MFQLDTVPVVIIDIILKERICLHNCIEVYFYGRKQSYNQSMKKEQRRFTPQHNLMIIRLIRQKFQPLKYSKASFHAPSRHPPTGQQYKQSKSQHLSHQISLPSLPSAPIHHILAERSQNQLTPLQKAKIYLRSKKKGLIKKEELVELKEYIQLFEKPVEIKQRGKRDSIQLSLLQSQTRKNLDPLAPLNMDHQQLQLNQQERSIMNAKIRRKLNHKKIIDLAKRS